MNQTVDHNNQAGVLVVDNERNVRRSLSMALNDAYRVFTAHSGKDAMEAVQRGKPDIVLLDILLPDMDGVSLLRKIKHTAPGLEVIIVTAVKDIQTAIRAIKSGAYEYVMKPYAVEEVRNVIHRALEKHRRTHRAGCLPRELDRHRPFEKMLGQTPRMREVFQLIATVAESDGAVLVQGESGTGKELVARAVHNRSQRKNKPFAVINCAAVPSTLMERELFGHNQGAFTNATKAMPGKLELAEGGTVFLDDIDSMDTSMQAKLLRAIQHKEFERLGGNRLIRADLRFVAACNKDLRELIRKGKFREDLFYRLNVFPIELPPLRHRRDDIPLLLNHFFLRQRKNREGSPERFSRNALAVLMNHDWPGNIRELENLVLRVSTVTRRRVIRVRDLPADLAGRRRSRAKTLKEAVDDFERDFIGEVLARAEGSRRRAAERLGIHRNTLRGKMSRLGLRAR